MSLLAFIGALRWPSRTEYRSISCGSSRPIHPVIHHAPGRSEVRLACKTSLPGRHLHPSSPRPKRPVQHRWLLDTQYTFCNLSEQDSDNCWGGPVPYLVPSDWWLFSVCNSSVRRRGQKLSDHKCVKVKSHHKIWWFFLFNFDKSVLPSAGAKESEAPAGCDVALSSEGSELPPGFCVVVHFCWALISFFFFLSVECLFSSKKNEMFAVFFFFVPLP